jgi:predicted GIY-YIG superfamily endonuclease
MECSVDKKVKRRGLSSKDEQILSSRMRLVEDPPTVMIDGSAPFRQGFKLRVPRQPEIYIINDFRGVLYIGRTDSLTRRFDEHFWREENPILAKAMSKPVGELTFNWIVSPYPDQIELERQLIKCFQPLCNRLMYHN